jgi:23S rRNA (adenine2030-N6)-methyltransferase
MVLCELHSSDYPGLRERFAGDRQVAVHHRDGYEALKAFLPPPERRGLVLIDPAYEIPSEWERAAEGLVTAWRRWPTGILAAWLPLLANRPEARLHRAVEGGGLRKVLRVELRVRPADSPTGMNGAEMLVVNPPWQLDQELREWLPWVLARLAPEGGGGVRVDWLVAE